ncbi:MAG TPA: 3'-5' exonuclease [Gallionella sp.]|nr:3'-5' exonuclease [Gallionella sp.]
MSWLRRWFGRQPDLSEIQQARLDVWRPQAAADVELEGGRFVVVDVETSGLNLAHDRLISIGAVAVVGGRIALGDSFSEVLQQQSASDRQNILLHGITGTAQLDGRPAADVLLDFLEYLGDAPLVAFHVTFDETMIRRALREHLGISFKRPWLDLAYLMPALRPELARRYRSLDDWGGHFDIRNELRHNALADALATAELFLVAASLARAKGISRFDGLRDLEKAQRWVSGEE